MLSKKTKYAIKALVHLAKNYGKGPILISRLSEEEKIPKKFLEAILLDLRKQGILGSKIGVGGGYYLIKKPGEVVLSQVLRSIDGPIALIPCVSMNFYERCDDCPDETICGIRDVVMQVRDASLKILSETTLGDILKRETLLKAKKKKAVKK
ncbi:MAG: rrf2 family protein putative transcriptional regulator [Bacteroidetes bacterium]|nr:rrf2 family protein putative transcriptional regulator [Bacteroidota bacterium]